MLQALRMSKLKQAIAVILLALNATLTVFLWRSQIVIAQIADVGTGGGYRSGSGSN